MAVDEFYYVSERSVVDIYDTHVVYLSFSNGVLHPSFQLFNLFQQKI
jgi:hypothetical protein